MIEGFEARKAARGRKLTCQDCEQRFYDLARRPAVCPLCGVEQPHVEELPRIDLSAAPRPTRVYGRPKPPPLVIAEPDAEAETEEADEAEEVEDIEDVKVGADDVDEGFLEESDDGIDDVIPAADTEDGKDT